MWSDHDTSPLPSSIPHCSPAAVWPLRSTLVKCSRNTSCLETEPAARVLTCHSEAEPFRQKCPGGFRHNSARTGNKVDVALHVLMTYFHQQCPQHRQAPDSSAHSLTCTLWKVFLDPKTESDLVVILFAVQWSIVDIESAGKVGASLKCIQTLRQTQGHTVPLQY